jgi:hypothetical protein
MFFSCSCVLFIENAYTVYIEHVKSSNNMSYIYYTCTSNLYLQQVI